MKPLCVIPARAGSKRLIGKNLAELDGKPLLAYTILAALKSGIFHTVYVSTEDPQIAEVAKAHGADVPYIRPVELAQDTITNVAVSLHMLEFLANIGIDHDVVYCLQPTSPLRSEDHISGAWETFSAGNYDSLVSITNIDPHYFHWAMVEKGENWRMYFEDKFLTVRQQLPPVYRPNGAIKIASVDTLRCRNAFFGERLGAYRMPEMASIHVVNKLDIILCEAILKWRQRECLT
jgi:CMP-N-acetylneuraminic acid synthetase